MNPLMNGNIMRIVSQVQRLRQNPNGIGDFLKQQGRINEQQYSAIQKMGGNPEQIGQYLMQSGAMNQQQAMQATPFIQQVQRQL